MKTHYTIFEESVSHPELGRYVTYGIKTVSEETSFASISVSDVSLSKSELSILVLQCNELQLSPIHLSDVIDDFLIS